MPELEFDVRDINKLKQQFDPRDVEKALRWAVNATSRKATTRISKETRKRYTVSAGDIRKRMSIERYRDDVSRAVLYTGRRLPLAQFKPREKWVSVSSGRKLKSGPRKGRVARRRGVTVQVRKGKSRKLVQGGWVAKGQLWRREKRTDNKSDPQRLFGPSIPEMVDNPQVIAEAQKLVREDLPEQFNGRLDYILNKKAGLV
ncbi:phage tail protein [Vreelandella venusta]|uniref:Phage tail protein n=1 Tax=Vreelandella venusta TaxID=44935 RepID=A0AAP9ZFY9_9GAMM|nr:phage tail protein [Halomonas venusta]QRL05136.1 phage tail protein [Halomonas venusta]GEK50902.1 hypothetical protein HVE01_16230 [Halomonas venusta]